MSSKKSDNDDPTPSSSPKPRKVRQLGLTGPGLEEKQDKGFESKTGRALFGRT